MRIPRKLKAYLFKGEVVSPIKLDLTHEWDSIVSFWHLDIDTAKSIERHEGNSSELLLVHDLDYPTCSLIIVDYDVEKTGPSVRRTL